MKISGIYKIVNKVNGKYYIGSSNNIHQRWNQHKSSSNNNCHKNSHFQSSWNKYGKDNFEFIIVEVCDVKDLLIIEQKYLDISKQEKKLCYNSSFIAERTEMSDINKNKLRERNKIQWKNEKYRRKMSKYMKDRWTDEFRKTHSKFMKQISKGKYKGINNPMYGKNHSNESKRKMGGAVVDYNGNKNPFFGKSHTEDSNEKNRRSHIDATIFHFKNIKTNEDFTGIKIDFIKQFNLKRGSVYRLTNKRKSIYKGWIII